MKKKIPLISLLILIIFLTACSGSVKTYPSLELPYEIVNEDVEKIKAEGLEEYLDYQVLEKIEVREITPEENEEFLKIMDFNTLNDLNTDYSAVEFNFGDVNRIHQNKKSFYKFDEDVSYFVYDDEIIKEGFYQLQVYENKKLLLKMDKKRNEEVGYGEVLNDFKIITLIRKDLLQKGLQFKTVINDEVVYLDIN